MNPEDLKKIERLNWVLGALAVAAAAVFFSREFVFGVALGALLTCANFWSIRTLTGRILRSQDARRTTLSLLLLGKMILLFALVFLAMWFLPISIPGLGAGLSVFLISVAVESLRQALRPTHKDEASDGRA
jgi:drug/metabolite transporter (DMT)-like permease